ncbi:tRNA-intron lyase [Pyrobaculum aerophilum]|uniref:tRNA-splicing endonuclease n=2 Tax=Pyrobaculum aerophilum TaxID=13773 RepID=ENDA_PYRAE|nr:MULTISPECIES: tRNA-intron lyase [Pyrobaculum]Q8ZVI1.1 RecName: Full=tRNA-splicing endonuclease; AltName: Full=tRNA-intron endonuclease [Pyrobaculum aerophilum str. IM2]2ZYZ_B Chain B, tRNA-splicing endonuclease [Pyrobaculum aerophilum]2ZYZ_D Chain D, tRNA-splicing endonuclease [Pyrobaculum aerophilum]AAL64075.1 tRNA intron endonuclease [Pyrobaculum aerophilum str. IM2]MCX8135820.1 tRNA-intron lyase [Pyrobaculum aerophilum]HII47162.1 tRNA-intron lyase [Pyrobaculum aerophilum]
MIGYLRGLAVIVEDVEFARRLYKEGFYGRFLGYDKVKRDEVEKINAPLILGLYEALYLAEKGRLKVMGEDGREVAPEELAALGRERMRNFDEIYKIYKYFRDLGYVVKSGLKFGALFSVYEKGPGIDHAPMVVVFLEPDKGISATDITRGGRLSHSVRKTWTLATVLRQTGEVVLLGFGWARL